MNFFSVSKFNNSFTIVQNIERLRSLYSKFNYSLIIPIQEKDKFEKIFKNKIYHNVKIITENQIISLEEFKGIYDLIIKKNKFKV